MIDHIIWAVSWYITNCFKVYAFQKPINRGYYMNVHLLLNLFNKLAQMDKMRGLPSMLSLCRYPLKIGARMLYPTYHMTLE